MSGVVSGASSTKMVENSYITILNKRIRAFKKKVDRIIALQNKKVGIVDMDYLKDLEPDQKELCSHFDVYSGILNELTAIKEQYLKLSPEDVVWSQIGFDIGSSYYTCDRVSCC